MTEPDAAKLALEYTNPSMSGQHWVIRRADQPGIVVQGHTYRGADELEKQLVDAYNAQVQAQADRIPDEMWEDELGQLAPALNEQAEWEYTADELVGAVLYQARKYAARYQDNDEPGSTLIAAIRMLDAHLDEGRPE